MKVLSELKKIHIAYLILPLFAGSAFCEVEAPATEAEASTEAIGDPALAERTKPFGQVYVADEPYVQLTAENQELKDKLAEAEMQVEDIKGQVDDLKGQLSKKDEEIASMKKKATTVAAVDPAAAAPAGAEKKAAPSGECKNHKVMATATTFEPKVLFINPCDSVTFQNMITHDAEAFDDLIPEGAKKFWVAMNQNGTITLDVEGVYIYKCNPHYPLGMAGAIVVGNATNFEQVSAKATGRSKGIVIKLKRALAAKKG
jgi:pseudoazurin